MEELTTEEAILRMNRIVLDHKFTKDECTTIAKLMADAKMYSILH